MSPAADDDTNKQTKHDNYDIAEADDDPATISLLGVNTGNSIVISK